MRLTLSTYFLCISFGVVLILLFAIVRYIYREKYAASFAKLPDARRERLVQSDKALVQIFRIFLWLSPLYLIIIPLIFFFFERESFPAVTICMALLVVTVWQEYLFRKWLINYVETEEIMK